MLTENLAEKTFPIRILHPRRYSAERSEFERFLLPHFKATNPEVAIAAFTERNLFTECAILNRKVSRDSFK